MFDFLNLLILFLLRLLQKINFLKRVIKFLSQTVLQNYKKLILRKYITTNNFTKVLLSKKCVRGVHARYIKYR